MSKAASSKKTMMDVPVYVEPTELHINLEKFPALKDCDAGETVSVMVTGKVVSKSLSARVGDQKRSSMTIEVKKLETEDYNDDSKETEEEKA